MDSVRIPEFCIGLRIIFISLPSGDVGADLSGLTNLNLSELPIGFCVYCCNSGMLLEFLDMNVSIGMPSPCSFSLRNANLCILE